MIDTNPYCKLSIRKITVASFDLLTTTDTKGGPDVEYDYLAVYKTMYENASKITLKRLCVEKNRIKWLTLCLHCLILMSLGSWRWFRAILASFTFWRLASPMSLGEARQNGSKPPPGVPTPETAQEKPLVPRIDRFHSRD